METDGNGYPGLRFASWTMLAAPWARVLRRSATNVFLTESRKTASFCLNVSEAYSIFGRLSLPFATQVENGAYYTYAFET